MPVLDLDALAAALPSGKRLMGLDVGEKTIGVALSDSLLMTASPIEVIRRTKFTADAEKLIVLIRAREATGIVIGLPVNMDGSEGPRCQSVRQFAANLLEKIDLPVAFWDERLSTAAVERMLVDEMDVSRARRREIVDKAAAAYILQGALEALRVRRG
ncbi:MAG: Holliday junction resolvase RuvX [Alphaproteobacteria bacterium]|nr:Holliday junction resolvase RuvX [Alphaproteobacteria bacterium]